MGFVEHFVEHLPAGDAFGAANPDIRGIDAAEDGESRILAGLNEKSGIAHVVFDERADLGFAFVGVEGSRTALDNVADAIKLGAVAAAPEGMNGVG